MFAGVCADAPPAIKSRANAAAGKKWITLFKENLLGKTIDTNGADLDAGKFSVPKKRGEPKLPPCETYYFLRLVDAAFDATRVRVVADVLRVAAARAGR